MHRRDLLRFLSLSAIAGATTRADALAERLAVASTEQTVPSVGFVPDVELRLTAAPDEVSVFPGAPTRVWRFAGQMVKGPADTLQILPGSYLGPVIHLRRGQKVRIACGRRRARSKASRVAGIPKRFCHVRLEEAAA